MLISFVYINISDRKYSIYVIKKIWIAFTFNFVK